MPILYFVPGLLGTTLSSDPAGQSTVWVSYSQLILGQSGKLRLAPDGTSPGAPDGIQLFPQGPLPDYYATTIAGLQSALALDGYTVRPAEYDFRLAIFQLGASLAQRIILEVDPLLPCTLVAHSYGGLVARAAWSALVAGGQSALVRRVITLGAPHQGSYAVVALFSGDSASVQQLAALAALGSGIVGGLVPAVVTDLWSPDQIEAVAATWPAIYSVLPSLGGTAAIADPNRPYLYTASHWSDVTLSQTWLDYARETVSPWLLSSASLPPSWVLTTMAGTGVPTPDRLVAPISLGFPAAYGSEPAGDGTVTELSALIPQSWQYTIVGRHMDLPALYLQSGDLVREVLAVRSAPTPVPPVEMVGGMVVPTLGGPPVPSLTYPPTVPSMSGDC